MEMLKADEIGTDTESFVLSLDLWLVIFRLNNVCLGCGVVRGKAKS